MPDDVQLQKHSKGQRPQLFSDPAIDKLLAMVMALAGEVAVMRDRNDTLERLIDDKGLIAKDEIESYRPSTEVMAERDAWRADYLSHILRIVDLDGDDMENTDISESWHEAMDSASK